ncbi:Similar to Rab37: Ras-related protein Rab-37 (Mus musculus) [Cotesia congregata]|uniref:Similar to Rab37: Ras-related protein Rab-37 (Mus musculus) n=1 Tax=Cotesia congregata TaxID=51543 RepID=A0A8J2HCA1_COTCN|nr:Similar to Rab37: Ras-related protein Rab-37 (Mus musculus) [Cotesia congregata]
MSRMEDSSRGSRSRGLTGASSDWSSTETQSASRGPGTPTAVTPGVGARGSVQMHRQASTVDDGPNSSQAQPETTHELHFKIMLLGDSGVGKTCLLTQFRDGRFLSGNHISTVGIDFRNKVVNVALLLLYDVTNKTSYDNIRAWLGEIREYAQNDVVIMLLGNKSDCGNERVIKIEDGKRLADEYQVPFMETSAKTGLNVELAFLAIAKQLKARKSGNPDDSKFNVRDYVRQESQQKKSTCFSSNCQTT